MDPIAAAIAYGQRPNNPQADTGQMNLSGLISGSQAMGPNVGQTAINYNAGGTANPSAATAAAQQAAAGKQQQVDAINGAYGQNAQFYNNELNQINPQRQDETAKYNAVFDGQQKALADQRDSAYANLDQQTKVANDSYGRSLNDLGNSIRNQYQSGNNQLGTQGAADSSAGNMLGYALGQQQNQQRGYMNQDLNNQLAQVGLTRNADKNQFEDQYGQVDQNRQLQMTTIAQKYQALVNQINGALVNNDTARKQALNYAGQWAASQAAIDPNVAGALAATKGDAGTAPTVAPQAMASYTAHNIVAPTVPVQSTLGNPISTNTPTQIYNPYKNNNQLGV